MAADFTIIDEEPLNHIDTTSQATSNAYIPAIGDLLFVTLDNSTGSGSTCTGGGMTWTALHIEDNLGDMCIAVYRATSGTPSSSVLTVTCSGDSFRDMAYVWVRPVDLTYVGVAGYDNTEGAASSSLTVSLTTSSPAALLAYFGGDLAGASWAEDTGWTEIMDNTNVDGCAHQLMERFSDDTEVIGDSSYSGTFAGLCLEFSSAGDGFGPTLLIKASSEAP